MKILYIISSYNLYGGTPKKTLDLMKYFGEQSVLYVYENSYPEFKTQFESTGGKVYEGFYGRNIYNHIIELLAIIDKEKVDIIHTQFSFGETLGGFVKLFRPKTKLVIAFVGPFKPRTIRKYILSQIYKKTDAFIYISEYVKKEKLEQFKILKNKYGVIIYNGTEKRKDTLDSTIEMRKISLFDIAGLIECKNISILIEAFSLLAKKQNISNIYLYVAGDGPQRKELENLIEHYMLKSNVFLLGYQKNVGKLLNDCDIFVHPAFMEGFGIVIAEAMLAEKPIIVANAGALPELIENEKTGLIVDPYNAEKWAEAIMRMIEDTKFAKRLAQNARIMAENKFSIKEFSNNYEHLYLTLLK